MASGRVSNSSQTINSLVNLDNYKSIDPREQAERMAKELADAMLRSGKKVTVDLNKFKEAEYKKLSKEQEKEDKKRIKEANELIKSGWQKAADAAGAQLTKALMTGVNSAVKGVDQYIQQYTRYMSNINTRLQSTGMSFDKIAAKISQNLGTSPYLRQEDMLSNLNKFVEEGIAYNLESRAYVATATAKIANTFNAFDSSLLRIIRIQQADSTVARLGMESLLTKFLNAQYEDTSYLNKTASVKSNLLEAESLMGYKGATEFEYAVQSWLGSMSALGVSDATINMISQGLGYLGSGNYSALLGNEGLRNLFGMAASKSGTDIGSLLTGGLTPGSASALLSNIVGIGQNIAGSGNNVTRSAFANLFGLSVSDIVSLNNITAKDLKAITENIVKYEDLRAETTRQLQTMGQRTSTSEKIQNVLSNIVMGLGANIASNPITYAIWEAANLLSNSGLDYTFDIHPFGVGTSVSMSQVMKTGILGVGAVQSIANAVGAMQANNLGGTSLTVWGEKETRGGRGLNAYSSGIQRSGATYIGALDSSDISSSLGDVSQEAKTYTGETEDTTKDVNAAITTSIAPNVEAILNKLNDWETKFSISDLSRQLGVLS